MLIIVYLMPGVAFVTRPICGVQFLLHTFIFDLLPLLEVFLNLALLATCIFFFPSICPRVRPPALPSALTLSPHIPVTRR